MRLEDLNPHCTISAPLPHLEFALPPGTTCFCLSASKRRPPSLRSAARLVIKPPVLYSSAVSRLRRAFLSDRFFFVTVRLLKRCSEMPDADFRCLAIASYALTRVAYACPCLANVRSACSLRCGCCHRSAAGHRQPVFRLTVGCSSLQRGTARRSDNQWLPGATVLVRGKQCLPPNKSALRASSFTIDLLP